MSSVRYFSPRLRLTALLRKPGGPPLEEALLAAQANLQELAPECRSELERQLEAAEAVASKLEGFDDARLAEIYDAAVAGIGLGEISGAGALDVALTSLCDLIDDLRAKRRLDLAGITVHLRAWRLLLGRDMDAQAARQMLDGLMQVSGRFAAP
jgi:hypothetical protein